MQYQPQYQSTVPNPSQTNIPQPSNAPQLSQPKKKHTGLIAGLCSGFGVALLAVGAFLVLWLTGFISIGGNQAAMPTPVTSTTPQQVAEIFTSAVLAADGQAIVDLMPDEVVSQLILNTDFNSEEEMAEYLTDTFSASIDYLTEMGGTMDYTVEDSIPVSDSELEDIQDMYADYEQVIAAETVPVTITIEIMGEMATETEEVPVIQIDETWYLDYYTLGW